MQIHPQWAANPHILERLKFKILNIMLATTCSVKNNFMEDELYPLFMTNSPHSWVSGQKFFDMMPSPSASWRMESSDSSILWMVVQIVCMGSKLAVALPVTLFTLATFIQLDALSFVSQYEIYFNVSYQVKLCLKSYQARHTSHELQHIQF